MLLKFLSQKLVRIRDLQSGDFQAQARPDPIHHTLGPIRKKIFKSGATRPKKKFH